MRVNRSRPVGRRCDRSSPRRWLLAGGRPGRSWWDRAPRIRRSPTKRRPKRSSASTSTSSARSPTSAGLTLRIVNTPFTGIFASLNNGDIDLIVSGVTINDRRRQSYDFTTPYFEARQLIAVHEDSTVRGLQDLTGKKVGVVTGSTGDDIASRAFGKTSPNIRRFDTTPLVIAELAAHGVDAAIGDNGVIAYRVQERKDLKTVSDPSFPQEYFGIAVKQGNTALRDTLNAGLAAIIADGTYARIYRKWFQAEPPSLPKK